MVDFKSENKTQREISSDFAENDAPGNDPMQHAALPIRRRYSGAFPSRQASLPTL
jgi:hypothetical protein